MKTIAQFYIEVKDNKELQAAMQEAMENGTCDAFLKEHQVEGTVEDVENYGKSHFKTGELSDDELEAVSGGYNWGRDPTGCGCEAAVTFQFKKGDHVTVYNGWFFGVLTFRAYINNVRTTLKDGKYYPEYHVVELGVHFRPKSGWYPQNYLCYD